MASNLTTCGEMKSVNPIDTNVNDKISKTDTFWLFYSNAWKYASTRKNIHYLQEEICPIPYTLILT